MSGIIEEITELRPFSPVDADMFPDIEDIGTDVGEDSFSESHASSATENTVIEKNPKDEKLHNKEGLKNINNSNCSSSLQNDQGFMQNSTNHFDGDNVHHSVNGKSSDLYQSKCAGNSKQSKGKRNRSQSVQRIKSKFPDGSIQSISDYMSGTIFSGWIKEREWVEHLHAYRDVIEVDEWEEDVNHQIKSVITSILGVKASKRWINITGPCENTPCYRLWVMLNEAPLPGHYWFNILDVTLDAEFGLKVNVNIMRRVNQFDGETLNERERRLKGSEMSPEEWKEWISSITDLDMKAIFYSVMSTLTPSNIASGFRLVIILSITLIVASVAFLRESWHLILRFMREFGILIHHATPFLQSVVAFFEKIMGATFILIAMVYKDIRRPNNSNNSAHPAHLPPATPQFSISSQPYVQKPQSRMYVSPESWSYGKGEF